MELKITTDKSLILFSEGRIRSFVNLVLWAFGIASMMFFAIFLLSATFVPNQENIEFVTGTIEFIIGMLFFAISSAVVVLVLEIRSYKRFNQDEMDEQ